MGMRGPKDRAKDASPKRGGDCSPPCRVACAWRTPTTFPSSATLEHPLSLVRSVEPEDSRADVADQPRSSFLRHPAKGAVLPETWVPSTVANTRDETKRRIASLSTSRSRVGLPLTPPTAPEGCRVFLALQASQRPSLLERRALGLSREQAPFRPAGGRLGLTTQALQQARCDASHGGD